jgi:uncharacterized phage protein (TIGR02220 family)
MNTDIRVLLSFRGSRKRRKLSKRLGAGSTDYLLDLWIGTATSRPDGILIGWDEEDIALEANYPGDPQELVKALLETGWLDIDEYGVYSVHDWVEHNPYAAGADERSDAGSKGAVYRWVRKQLSCGEYTLFKEWFKAQEYKKGTGHKEVVEQYRLHAGGIPIDAGGIPIDAGGNAPTPYPNPNPEPYPNPEPDPTPIVKDKNTVLPVPDQDGVRGGVVMAKRIIIPYKAIVDDFNTVCGTKYQAANKKTKGLIKARWAEGFRVADFRRVVVFKHGQWCTDEKSIPWIRPQTLFSGNFEAYLQEASRDNNGGLGVSEAEAAMEGIRREQETT